MRRGQGAIRGEARQDRQSEAGCCTTGFRQEKAIAAAMDVAAEVTARLAGREAIDVQRREYDWAFIFADDIGLRVECPWRILVSGRIALGRDDHGQKFGLSSAVDGQETSRLLLRNKSVQEVSIRSDTGDLAITFSGHTILEVLNASSGYEGWELHTAGLTVIATGGGELAIVRQPKS